MKTILQVVSWIGIVLGVLALWGTLAQFDPYALIGGGMFFFQGLLALMYISEVEKEKNNG